MSDLIERLRTELAVNPENDWTQFAKDVAEAADEIERLRAVYEAAKRHVAHDSDSDFADIKRDEDALIAALKDKDDD